MRYGSVCSGIEAATAAWHPLGWQPVFFAEIEKFPQAVLRHHYGSNTIAFSRSQKSEPRKMDGIWNLGDMTTIRRRNLVRLGLLPIDVLVGGTPCQAFSVAGLRKSLADDRGNLTLCFVRLADAIDPRYVVWENVPGVLSTGDNAFGCFLAALVGADSPLLPASGQRWTDAGVVDGPKRRAAWRTLDAQYFRLAQRRKRVFVIASTPEGAHPGEILFEREGLQRHSPPSRETREEVAATVGTRAANRSGDTVNGGGLQLSSQFAERANE